MIATSVTALRQPSRVGAWTSRVRSVLWRAVCWALGGLTVTGELPRQRAYVVVANHSSHADTAALLAALPAASRPVFAAAADYWFDVPARRAVASGLAGILPVRRGAEGAYAALLAAARPALVAGRTVVVYSEGTRSTDGQVGEFHSGAVRLAADCGVALVPVAVLGTREVLPKHGRVRPKRPTRGNCAPMSSTCSPGARPGAACRRWGNGWRGWPVADEGCGWRSSGASARH